MRYPKFSELPFNKRPDLTPYLLHLTKSSKDGWSALENLTSILMTGQVYGSDSKGFVRGPNTAACFMDVPFSSLKYVLTPKNTNRYQPFGIAVTKSWAYKHGMRPVLYLSKAETDEKLKIPQNELWRVVTLERTDNEGWINWAHEREWRSKGPFRLPTSIHAAIVRDTKSAKVLRKQIEDDRASFKCIPDSILPATVICQGLVK